jgi:hypothetical protein
MKLLRHRTTRRLLLALALIAGLGGGYYLLRHVAGPAYRTWSIGKMNTMAGEFLAVDDPRNALLTARKVLRKRADDGVALRLAAAAAHAQDLPEAVLFQRQLSRVEPSPAHRLAYLRLALHYRAHRHALEAIDRAGAEDGRDPEFHRLAAEVFGHLGRAVARQAHLLSLLALEPGDVTARLHLAQVEFDLYPVTGPEDWSGRVEALSRDPTVGQQAQLLLLRWAVARGEGDHVARLVAPLLAREDLALDGQLQVIAALRLGDAPRAAARLAALQGAARADPEQVVAIMASLSDGGHAAAIGDWYPTLDETVRQHERVKAITAEALLTLGAWDALEQVLRGARWTRHETRRQVLLARVYRETARPAAFAEAWKLTLIAADGDDVAGVAGLLRTVTEWRWEAEQHEVRWKLFHLLPATPGVHDPLIAREFLRGQTANLHRIFARMVEAAPDNHEARNNFAYTGLLLNLQAGRAQTMARDLHWQHPTNNTFRTTYAFALYKQGAHHEALALLGQLDDIGRFEPGARLQEALNLAALGQGVAAAEIKRELARVKMLPEERALLEAAGAQVRQRHLLADRTRQLTSNGEATPPPGGWLELLPAAPPLTTDLHLADTYYREQNLGALQELLVDPRWAGPAHLRLGVLAYVRRQAGEMTSAREHWRQAGVAAGREDGSLRDLEALAGHWGWTVERIEVARRRYEYLPADTALRDELLAHYRQEGRTAELARVLWLYLDQVEASGRIAAWGVYYSLLIRWNVMPAQILAARLHERDPADDRYRLAYALVLARQQRAVEAWSVLEPIVTPEVDGMSAALVQAQVLLDLDRQPEAIRHLRSFNPATALPEERYWYETLNLLLSPAGAAPPET